VQRYKLFWNIATNRSKLTKTHVILLSSKSFLENNYPSFSLFQRSLGHSAYPVELTTLALTDIRGKPREAVEEFGGQGRYRLCP
jgi:hypothetical protein